MQVQYLPNFIHYLNDNNFCYKVVSNTNYEARSTYNVFGELPVVKRTNYSSPLCVLGFYKRRNVTALCIFYFQNSINPYYEPFWRLEDSVGVQYHL